LTLFKQDFSALAMFAGKNRLWRQLLVVLMQHAAFAVNFPLQFSPCTRSVWAVAQQR